MAVWEAQACSSSLRLADELLEAHNSDRNLSYVTRRSQAPWHPHGELAGKHTLWVERGQRKTFGFMCKVLPCMWTEDGLEVKTCMTYLLW